VTKEAYEKAVKQPMDLGTIQKRLCLSHDQAHAYKSVSNVSKDVNRIFSNVVKVWSPGRDEIASASQRLQNWWIEQWHELVPILMTMKPDSDATTGEGEIKDTSSELLEGCSHFNNERSDDYQEQLGMPDEEDMRSWSHHYRTDTVDDPIFRAAMRGCDSVSFVFGLEVTWSLIQQRKQEEEDRQALRELEAMEELQKLQQGRNYNNDDDDAKTSKENGSNETEDVQMRLEDLDDDDNDIHGESTDNENETSTSIDDAANLSGCDDVVAIVTEDTDLSEESSGGCPGHREGNAEAKVLDDSPANYWSCGKCTLSNPMELKKCAACCTKRSTLRRGKKRSRKT
jgi:hypothetical protein